MSKCVNPNINRSARFAGSVSVLALACGALSAGGAQAQTAPAAAPAPAAAQPSAIGEVVVTAERRAVNTQTTAISMSVLNGAAIQEQKVVEISDLQNATPGLSVTNSGLTQNVNIRGLGNTTISPAVTTGVPIFRDGLYEPEAILLNEPFYDIADVDVERGPQGTVIGQNSTGGAVLINSKSPTFDGLNGYVEAEAGNYNERRANGAINLPINDQWAARIAFNVRTRDSFYNNVGTNLATGTNYSNNNPGSIDEKNFRLGLVYKPNDNFTATLKAELNNLNDNGILGVPSCVITGCSGRFGYPGYSNPFTLDYPYPEADHQNSDRYSLELKWRLDNGITLRSLSGIQDLREDKIDSPVAPPVVNGVTTSAGQNYDFHVIGPRDDYYQQEFDILSPDSGKVTWLLGASYFHRVTGVYLDDYALGGALPVPQTPYNTTFVISQSSTQRLAGIFGQLSFQLADTLQLQLGARYSMDSNSNSGFIAPLGFDANGKANGPPIFPLSDVGKYSDHLPTGKIALNWTPAEGQFLYAFAARGYKEGGFAGPGNVFQYETVNDYEAGWKSELFDRRLRLQIGGYYMNYNNMQQQVINPISGGGGVYNIGASTIYGAEFSAQGRIDDWIVDAGLALNHSSLGSIQAIDTLLLPGLGSQNLGGQCAAGQTTGCYNYAAATVSLSGEANPYSPTVTFNADLGYTFHMGDEVTLVPRVNVSYQSDQYASIFQNTPFYLLPAHTLVDLSLTYSTEHWTLELWSKNVANKLILAGITSGNLGEWADPRTIGLSVRRNF